MDETPLSAIAQSHAKAIKSTTSIYSDILRIQQESMRTALEPFWAALRVQNEFSQSITATVASVMAAQFRITDVIARPLAAVLRVQDEFRDSIAGVLSATTSVGITMRVAELSGLASHFNSLTRFAGMDASRLWQSALDEAKALERDADTVRDNLFARYDGAEYQEEREAVSSALARIPDFDTLPPSAKLVQLIEIAQQATTSDVQNFVLGVAGNLLATILSPDRDSAGFWLSICFLLFVVCQMNPKQRVPQTRRILRNIPIDARMTRIVSHCCTAFRSPQRNAKRLSTLDEGAVVVIVDQFKGWRQVRFTNRTGQQRLGWVKSKYLRKV